MPVLTPGTALRATVGTVASALRDAFPRRGRRLRAVVAVSAAALALAACSQLPAPVGSSPDGLRASQARRPAPIAARAINLQGQCAQTEEDGFREQATLQVRDNVVQALAWQLWVGKRGSCRFEQAEFSQTRNAPHIELLARDGSGCKLMIWQDPRRVTLAHAGCERRCTPGIYDQAWPVMFDPDTGRCARLAQG